MKYLIWGYYGFGNFGDELMLDEIVKRIIIHDKKAHIYIKCKEKPNCSLYTQVTPFCIEKLLFRKRNKIINYIIYLLNIVKILTKIDILVIGGGGLFIDKGRHNISFLILTITTMLAKILRKKIYMIGVGIDHLKHPFSKFYLKFILRCADKVFIREKYGYIFAKSLIQNKEKIFLTADILFSQDIVNFLKRNFISKNQIYLGLSLIDYYLNYEPNYKKRRIFIQNILEFIKVFLDRNIPIKFLIFQEKEGDKDEKLIEDVLHNINDNSSYISIKSLKSIEDILDVYKDLFLVVGMRYHSLVFCGILQIPFIGINHERKIQEICMEFDMPYIDIDKLTSYKLCEEINNLKLSFKRPFLTEEITKRADLNFSFLKELNYENINI